MEEAGGWRLEAGEWRLSRRSLSEKERRKKKRKRKKGFNEKGMLYELSRRKLG